MTPVVRAIVETEALRHNLGRVRAMAPGCPVLAVIKANAYGHGIVPAAVALAGADGFAVARLEEGIALREAGLAQRILLLEGVFGVEQLRLAAHHDLDIMVHPENRDAAIELLLRAGYRPREPLGRVPLGVASVVGLVGAGWLHLLRAERVPA
jgi:alanine racemase